MDLRALAMGLAFALIWSSAFTSARIIVTDASPIAALAFRFFVSGIIGVGIALVLGQTWRLTREQWRATLIFGLCQNAIYLGLNFYAMQTVPASVASIIASTMPLMVAFASWAFLRERLPAVGALGLMMGLAGVALIMVSRVEAGVDLVGIGLCVIASAALTIATLSVRAASAGGNLMMVVGLQMFVGAAVLAVISALTETIRINPTPEFAIAFIYTTLFPGVIATAIWFSLVARIGATRAATFHFLNPFFGVAIAAVLLSEQLGWLDFVGVLIITIGILAVQLSKQRAA